jgi:hypothetical protein
MVPSRHYGKVCKVNAAIIPVSPSLASSLATSRFSARVECIGSEMGNFALDLRGVGATRTALGVPGKTPRSRRPLWIGRAEWNGSDDNLLLKIGNQGKLAR